VKVKTPHVMNDLLALSHVPRWSVVSHTGHQSVADHSFRVAVIYLELCLRLDRAVGPTDLMWIIVHDGPEAWIGDIPGPFKTANAEAEVTPWWHDFKARVPDDVRALVKVADLVEGATWIERWGVGHQAAWAAQRSRGRALEKAREVAELVGYGPERLYAIVEGLMMDITAEIGRCGG